jgi:hypothetical protein
VLGRVLHQRGDGLREAHRVGVEQHALARHQHRQAVAGGGDVRAARLERHVHHRLERHALAAQLQAPARHALDVDQVVDQARELLDLALDHALAPGHFRVLRAFAAKDRGGVAHRGERVAQLVRERGQELVFAALLVEQRLLHELAVVDVGADRHPAVGGRGVRPGQPALAQAGEARQALVLHALALQHALDLGLDLARCIGADHLGELAPDDALDRAPHPARVERIHPLECLIAAAVHCGRRHRIEDDAQLVLPCHCGQC